MGVELGQVGDAAHVGSLIQDGEQRRVEPAAAVLRGVHRAPQHPVGEGSDQRSGGAAAVLGKQVQRLAGADEGRQVEPVQPGPRRGPGGDLRVTQAPEGGAAVNSTDPRVSAGASLLARSERARAG